MLALWAGACGDDPVEPVETPNRAPIVSAPIADAILAVDEVLTVNLATHFSDPDGDPLSYRAESSSQGVATVAVSGGRAAVEGVGRGTATITVTATDPGGLSVAESFAVTVAAPQPASVVVDADSATLTAIGDTIRLTAEVFDESGQTMTGVAVTWSSENLAVATVDAAGLVTATGRGGTTITAAAGTASAQAAVSVMPAAHMVNVSPPSAALPPGDELALTASVTDRNGHPIEEAEVAWASNDPGVAVVRASGSGTGIVRAVAAGSATITASSGAASGTSRIIVTANQDHTALLALYESTGGRNWKNNTNWLTDEPLGSWHGVRVDEAGRVTEVVLPANNLDGQIPPEVGSLTRLRKLELQRNRLHGRIPPELGSLTNLRMLRLDTNFSLTGPIPPQLGSLSQLTELLLGFNRLSGPIPPELGSLANLTRLNLFLNQLAGPIPPQLGSLANLEALLLGFNRLTGQIPPELGSLARLERLILQENDLSGAIPPQLGGLTHLTGLRLESNRLTGLVPGALLNLGGLSDFTFEDNATLCAPGNRDFTSWLGGMRAAEGPYCNAADMAALTSLYHAAGGSAWTNSSGWLADAALDQWHGVTADSLGRVLALDLSGNGLVGRVPAGFAELTRMTELRIGDNTLSGRLPLGLVGLPLREFHYADTELCTPVVASFRAWLDGIASHLGTGVECGRLSDRDALVAFYDATGGPGWSDNTNWLTDASLDSWHGVETDGEGNVTRLLAGNNNLKGFIPPELGSLSSPTVLFLGFNDLTGPIPPELGSLTSLESLHLRFNKLTGPIPPELGSLPTLRRLNLGNNSLTGSIPPELGSLGALSWVMLNDNDLAGSIPPELGNLAGLDSLDFSGNDLTGPIPPGLGRLANLKSLLLRQNDLTGPIPGELGRLRRLEGLMLSENDLTGPVPSDIGDLGNLTRLTLFGNAGLSGSLPRSLTGLGRLREFQAGNTGLCAPSDPHFQSWLRGIPDSRVALCGSAVSMAYLTQAAQSREFPVPLVAGEEALLRVFVTAMRSTRAGIPPVRARFFLDGSETYVANLPGRTNPIPTRIDESSLSNSANARIPGHIVQPGLEMVIEVDPERTLDPSLGVNRRIPETGRLVQDVQVMPTMDLTLIPFLWTEDPDSTILDIVREMAADSRNRLWPIHTLLPVNKLNVVSHEPVWSSSNRGFNLLEETEAIRVMEGGRGYYLSTLAGASGGLSGVAKFGGRSSWARPDPGAMAHELGHNLRLQHAPCGGAGRLDPAFPRADGSIGVWGYDFRGEGRLVPASTPDYMAYCDPYWTSDYHFTSALRHRLEFETGSSAASAVAAPVRALMVWGGVDAGGNPSLEPAFVVNAPPVLPDGGGDYRLEGRDADGRRLFSISFEMPEVSDGDGSSGFAFAVPVEPGWADGLATITLSGPDGSVTLDGESNRPMTILRNPRSGRVRGILRDLAGDPAVGADAEAFLPSAAGLEVLFSRGLPDAEAWRR